MKNLLQSEQGPISQIAVGLSQKLDAQKKTTHKNNADDDTFGEHQDGRGFVINAVEV
jgi:hypothetical protein